MQKTLHRSKLFVAAFLLATNGSSISASRAASLESEQNTRLAQRPTATSPMVEYTLSFINGLWDTDWGPLTFKATPLPDGRFSLVGSWKQSAGTGVIQSGTFDPPQGLLQFRYYQSWNNVNGQATFRLSADKRTLSGNWSQSNGDSGTWVLRRPGTWRLPPPPKVVPVTSTPGPSGGKPLQPQKALPPSQAIPPVAALPAGSALNQGTISGASSDSPNSGGRVTVIPVPGAAGSSSESQILLRDEGCKKRLTTGADMLFEFDKSDLTANAVNALQILGDAVKRYGLHPIIIEGHTDAIGTDEYNQRLSERRAQTVKQWLLDHSFVSQSASVVGQGEKHPVAPNNKEDGSDNPPGRALNRRVEVIVDTCSKYGADGVTIEVDEEGVKAARENIEEGAIRHAE